MHMTSRPVITICGSDKEFCSEQKSNTTRCVVAGYPATTPTSQVCYIQIFIVGTNKKNMLSQPSRFNVPYGETHVSKQKKH